MMDFVGNRVGSLNYYLGNYVDEKLRAVSVKLNGHVLNSTDKIAEKIGDIAESTSGECSYDNSVSSQSLYVSEKRIEAISEMRRARPEAFERMADFADEFIAMSDEDEEKGRKSTRLLIFVSTLTGIPSEVLGSRVVLARQRGFDG